MDVIQQNEILKTKIFVATSYESEMILTIQRQECVLSYCFGLFVYIE